MREPTPLPLPSASQHPHERDGEGRGGRGGEETALGKPRVQGLLTEGPGSPAGATAGALGHRCSQGQEAGAQQGRAVP